MLKRWGYVFIIVVLLNVLISARAETEESSPYTYNKTLTASVQYFQIPGSRDARVAYTTYYVSEDEIWWGGSNWISCTNSKGKQQYFLLLTNIPFEDSSILCISKVGNQIMMGFIDWETRRSCIGVLTIGDTAPVFYTLAGLINAESFYATPKGIMVVGTIPDQEKPSNELWCVYMGPEGQTYFENSWKEADESIVPGYRSLRIRETSDGFVILAQRFMQGFPTSWGTFTLQCWTDSLKPLWSIQLSDDVLACNNITVSDDTIYIIGETIEDVTDGHVSYRNSCFRFSLLGEEQEPYFSDAPGILSDCFVNASGFIAVGSQANGTPEWYMITADQNHHWQIDLLQVQVDGDLVVRDYFYADDGTLYFFGSLTNEDFFILKTSP